MVFDIAPPNDACQREVQFITTGKGEIRRFSLIKTKVHERWWTVPSVLFSMVDYSNGPILSNSLSNFLYQHAMFHHILDGNVSIPNA